MVRLRMTAYDHCMTMLSFRVDDDEAADVQEWARRLGVDRSQLLREATRRYLLALASEREAEAWERQPQSTGERALERVADWGPAEEWADWADETR